MQAVAQSLADLQALSVCRVEEFISWSQRISITLEQYDLPSELLHFVPQYQLRRLQY